MLRKMKAIKFLALLLVSALLISSVPGTSVSEVKADSKKEASEDWVYDESLYEDALTYYYYLQQHEGAARPEKEVAVDVTKFEVIEDIAVGGNSGTVKYQNREGSKAGVYIGAKGEQVVFTVNVPKTGLYCIEMDYFALAESNSQIMFGVYIDGELPFTEANSCMLSRVYKNEPIVQDEFGDDLRPKAIQTPQWRKQFLYDQTGVYGNLSFYLERGKHEIALCFDGTPLLLQGMTLKQEPYMLSYQDYISLHKQKGVADTKEVVRLFQAEDYYQQSSSMLYPNSDRTTPLVQPFDYDHIRINYGGGARWMSPGQWISWKVEAPADGFYYIGFKYRQSYLDGLFSSRKIYIDGEVPFEELSSVRFDHNTQWENLILGDEYEPYSIYLTKGEHIITMENVVGDLNSTMSVLQTVINNLNELYLSVIMITGSEPDPYRDYYLNKLLPNLPADLRENADLLLDELKQLEEVVGTRGSETAFFENIAYNLQSYADNIPDLTYKERVTDLKNDISSLSAKLSTYQEQALDLDYIALISPDKEMPRTNMTVWEWLKFQAGTFTASFRLDKAKKAKQDAEDNTIRVWINTGNDQFEILKDMITDIFTPQTGIQVDLELVQGTLIEATVSGSGPDVALGIVADTVVNLGMRGALVDLSTFDGFQETLDEYMIGAEIPFTLEGRCYAMPNTTGFSVMFIRTDIFNQMGLEVPDTWDDMYDVAQVLQRYNMTLGSAGTFANLLYQKGGSYFDEGVTKVLFDEDVAVEALTQHAEFYTKYGFPITFDFVSRFRTGEMPIGIAAYNIYNTLKYSAPEISGLWEMYCIPGSVREDGTVNYTQVDNTGQGAIMFEKAKNKDLAWEFIKWWSKAEAQTRYANDLEAAMGVSARYNTANLEVMKAQDWNNKELSLLLKQVDRLQFIPIVPGNYYVTRGLTNATRGVIYDGENAREMLTEWTIRINDEITRKRMEFYQNN